MNILKTAKRKAIEEARRTAKDVSGEILEIPKSIPKQAVGKDSGKKVKETTSGLPKLPSFKGFDVGEDIKNLPKDVSSQVVGKKMPSSSGSPQRLSPIVEAMQETSSSSDEGTVKPVKKFSLEEEMNRLRALRDKQTKEWEEQQKVVMGEPQAPTKPGAPIAPPTSPMKGPKGGGPKKAQIETRKSKH